MLFVGTGDTVRVVWTGDPAVEADGDDRWLRADDTSAKVGKAAHVFTVRPLSGREWARLAAHSGDLDRAYECAEQATEDCQPRPQRADGEALGVRASVAALPLEAAAGLFLLVQRLSYGEDPWPQEDAAADAAPKSDAA